VQVEDVIQSGMIGLLDAVTRYEPSQGAQFETYAVQRIRGAMLDGLRQTDWLPRGLRKNLRSIEASIAKLEQQNGRAPSEQQLADDLGVSLDEYQKMLQDARGYQLVYFDDFKTPEDDDFLDRHCVDSQPTPLDRLLDKDMRQNLVHAIEELPPREKLVMGLHYDEEMNFREIGEVLGVGESRVCQLHTQAVARLRGRLKEMGEEVAPPKARKPKKRLGHASDAPAAFGDV
jgi:RNA polymerase sigma factor for flagellar operon FliA